MPGCYAETILGNRLVLFNKKKSSTVAGLKQTHHVPPASFSF